MGYKSILEGTLTDFPAPHWSGSRAYLTVLKLRSRPISRVLSRTVIHLGCTSPCTSSDLPESHADHMCGTGPPLSYLVLLQVGFSVPRPVTRRAVRSYRTISPLPEPEGHRRYVFCGTVRGLAPPRCYLAPCPVEPGLSSARTQRLPGRLQSQWYRKQL